MFCHLYINYSKRFTSFNPIFYLLIYLFLICKQKNILRGPNKKRTKGHMTSTYILLLALTSMFYFLNDNGIFQVENSFCGSSEVDFPNVWVVKILSICMSCEEGE